MDNRKYEYELILCKPNKEELLFLEYSDLTFNPMFLEYSKLSITIHKMIDDETENPYWNYILPDYIIYLKIKSGYEILYKEYFVIEGPSFTSDDIDSVNFTCYSYEKSFLDDMHLEGFRDNVKRLYDSSNSIDETDKLPKGILNYILDKKFNNCWKLDHIDSNLLDMERVLTFSGNTVKSVFDTLAESFKCAFIFNNVNMTLRVYDRNVGFLGENKGLIIADDNYAVNFKYEADTSNIKTRLTVSGKNQAHIAKYNPTGQMYVDDFSYYMNLQYMTQDLIDALTQYNNLVKSKDGLFASYIDRLNDEDESVLPLIEELKNELLWENNFTESQIKELTYFIKEEIKTINTISDTNELYKYALRHLKTISVIPLQVTIEAIDVFELYQYQFDWAKLKVGDFVNLYRKEFNLEYKEMRLIGYSHNPVKNSLQLEFSNVDELITREWQDNMFFKTYFDIRTDFTYNKDLYTAIPDFQTPDVVQQIENIIDNTTITNISSDSIVDVVENQFLVSDTAMLLNAWIRYLLVEQLETNFDAIDPRSGMGGSGTRNFIRVKDQNIDFLHTDTLSEEVYYQVPDGKGGWDPVYWTAIEPHLQAYRYFTITDPVSVQKLNIPKGSSPQEIEELEEELREKYRVKIRKEANTIERLTIKFDESHEFKIPRMIWGHGDGISEKSGKGYIYKESDGMYVSYGLRVPVGMMSAGDEIGLRVTDLGVEYLDVNSRQWLPIGSGGGAHVLLDHLPSQIEIDGFEDDSVVHVYDPNSPFVPVS